MYLNYVSSSDAYIQFQFFVMSSFNINAPCTDWIAINNLYIYIYIYQGFKFIYI